MRNITQHDIITSSGRYIERAKSPELTDEVKANMDELRTCVNELLEELGWDKDPDTTSGFRPSAVNAGVAGAAKKSAHMQGLALDLMDDKAQTLAKKIQSRPDLLKKYGLWLENPEYTKGSNTNWVHLDKKERKDRPSRVFNP